MTTDTERLDWLEARGYPGQFVRQTWRHPFHGGEWFDSETAGSDYSPTLRAAIDSAMRIEQAEVAAAAAALNARKTP